MEAVAVSNGAQAREFQTLRAMGRKQVPVVQAPELANLFPHRTREALDALKLSILANGQEGRCLYASLDGETLLCVDGIDTSKAITELLNEGRPIDVAWDLYTPKAKTKEKILLELMALVIRRKNLQTAVAIDAATKEAAIRAYLITYYSQGLFPTDRWVGEDLDCSGTWVGRIRAKAVKEGALIAVEKYHTRSGHPRSATTKREIFAERQVIPIGTTTTTKLESETEDGDDLARQRAEQEADRLIAKANEEDSEEEDETTEELVKEANERRGSQTIGGRTHTRTRRGSSPVRFGDVRDSRLEFQAIQPLRS